jgi:hypothetical protein
MIKHALFVRLEARPGKEQAVADFLTAGLERYDPPRRRPRLRCPCLPLSLCLLLPRL